MNRKQLIQRIRSLPYEADRLALLEHVQRPTLLRLHDEVQQRVALCAKVRQLSDNGRVGVVFSGRDCDGVQYSGRACVVGVAEVYATIRQQLENAEGPTQYKLCSASDVDNVEYKSVDLTLRAFEDGHPHILYSSGAL